MEREREPSEQAVNLRAVSSKNGGEIVSDEPMGMVNAMAMDEREHEPWEKLQEQVVNPWADESLIDRVQRLTSRQPHVFLRRGVFFVHKWWVDTRVLLVLYASIGGLQETFKVPLVIQLTDDEKCIWKNITVEESQRLARENAKDIIACGFDVTKTFIFSDFDYVGGAFYKNMVKVSKCLSLNKAKATFGFRDKDPIGKLSFPPVQDPYFRMTRDIAPGLGYCKPALIESSFFPALKASTFLSSLELLHAYSLYNRPSCFSAIECLVHFSQGENGKMSASDPNSAIYVTDTAKDIKNKVNGAVSGGKDTVEKQILLGADLEEYGEGRMQTGAVKGRLVEVLTEMVERHHRARACVTDEMVDAFMAVRPLPNMFE
ncbi:unnamed protein product [Arabis nemorensis]|uniref:tryptophan--tRNA ligase n=1 Tax=Arabis nemorensis TaxID=586526 RepID=A0A565B5Q3_9BRAS|nr:unnamed protein product [Arabis nemorensis]